MRSASMLMLAIAFAVPACAHRTKGAPSGWPAAGDWIVDGHTGVRGDFARVLEDLAGADVVFVGEDHENRHHHEVQRRIAEALVARKPDLAFGFEMLQTDDQAVVDRFASGAIDLDTLAMDTDWPRTWGYPIALYRPLFDLARARGARVHALNTPEKLVRRVREVGVEGLAVDESAALPELNLEDPAHKEWVRAAFAAHHTLPEDKFRRFYSIQVLWEETMAEAIAQAIRRDGAAPRPMIVFAGTGHLIRRLGIPSRLERRVPGVKTRVVLALPVLENTPREIKASVSTRDGDWLWITPDSDAAF